ncbi:MAG: DUF4197 domain-containing protein [Gammaproteobacteria bacterium]|nr:DUF4197 domain-containing protein [Gammaproteobacteria bacterium]
MRTGSILVAAVVSSAAMPAAADWWDKGAEFFKSLTAEEGASALTAGEVGDAFKEALTIGSRKVVKQLGAVDGFNADAAVHIPLPEQLQTVKKALAAVGLSGMVDELELKLNRAAEAAAPKARKLFVKAISQMTFDDVMVIYRGPEDSATRYFQDRMSPSLREEMRPIVDVSLAEVGAVKAYDEVVDRYRSLPFVPDVKADLTEHVLDKGIAGIFHYVAKEEAAIRSDPARRTTELLKKVFGPRS